jgi:hypothetical protein
MKAELLIDERHALDARSFAEIVVWRLQRAARETGKGDHRHVEGSEEPYDFTGPDKLLADFWREVEGWRR